MVSGGKQGDSFPGFASLDEMCGWTKFVARRRAWLDEMCGWTKFAAG
jgi:hypothetical protein